MFLDQKMKKSDFAFEKKKLQGSNFIFTQISKILPMEISVTYTIP